jgi:SAM-dependent methyltransferase
MIFKFNFKTIFMVYEKIREEWDDPDAGSIRKSPLPRYLQYSLILYERMPVADGMKIVDVGCKNIRQWFKVLRDRKNVQLFGVDVSPIYVSPISFERSLPYKRSIESVGNNNRVELILRKNERLPFPDDFCDMSVAIEEVIYAGKKAEKEVEEVRRIAKTGGDVILTFSHKNLWKNLPSENLKEINKRYQVPVVEGNIAKFEDGTEHAVFDENGVKSLLERVGLKAVTMETYPLGKLGSKDDLLSQKRKSTIYVESKKI